jgi:hypothetical protein
MSYDNVNPVREEEIEIGDLVKVKPDYALESERDAVGIVLEIEYDYYSRFDDTLGYHRIWILWAGRRLDPPIGSPPSTRKREIDAYLEARQTSEPSNALMVISKGRKR